MPAKALERAVERDAQRRVRKDDETMARGLMIFKERHARGNCSVVGPKRLRGVMTGGVAKALECAVALAAHVGT